VAGGPRPNPTTPPTDTGAGHNVRVPVWGVVNQKGGVGKTTTAVNLAAGLALKGRRVLLVDCDPQGNATTNLGVDKRRAETTLYEVLLAAVDEPQGEDGIRKAIVPVAENLDLVPATLDLAGAEAFLLNAVGKELILRDALETVRGEYHWIVLDAPPSLGLLTVNILGAADAVLVPMQCEFFALEGLSQLLKTIEIVRRRINPSLGVAKVLLTLHDGRNKLTQQVSQEVVDYFGDKVSHIVIPRNVRLSESPSFGEPAVSRFPSSKGAGAYLEFVEEVLQTCGGH
jgi:chromosome partitioning protein